MPLLLSGLRLVLKKVMERHRQHVHTATVWCQSRILPTGYKVIPALPDGRRDLWQNVAALTVCLHGIAEQCRVRATANLRAGKVRPSAGSFSS